MPSNEIDKNNNLGKASNLFVNIIKDCEICGLRRRSTNPELLNDDICQACRIIPVK